jgi:integrase
MVAKVLQFTQPEKQEPKKKQPGESTGVIRKPGSNKLYLELYPNGVREQVSSRMDDTPENEQILIQWIKRQRQRIKDGTFVFANAFPYASKAKKQLHARLEGRLFKEEPNDILFTDYIAQWEDQNLDNLSDSGKRDYACILNYWVKPGFKNLTLGEFTGITLKEFVKKLKHRKGPKRGAPLSTSRRDHILDVIRAIWEDAVEDYQMERRSPFLHIKRFLKEDKKKRGKKPPVEVFRFDEWAAIQNNIFPHYRPMVGLMIRTGMSQSEISGLKKSAVRGGYLYIENSIVRNVEKDYLKTKYRTRKIKITKEIQKCLDMADFLSEGEYFFRTTRGGLIEPTGFIGSVWKTAIKKAGVSYKVPYTMRHTFAAWSLTIGMNPNRLHKLMGHGTKKMVYEVYGDYVEGLEDDADKIMEYFGNDFK